MPNSIRLFALFLGLVLLLPCGVSAQEEAAEEDPNWLQRFIAIFEVKDSGDAIPVDSLTAVEATRPGVTERYATVYNLIHRDQQAYYKRLADSSHTRWDELTDLPEADYISPDGDTVKLAKNVRVFGWHPHWMGKAYENYPFKLLSHVSLFSYNINGNDGAPFDNPEVVEDWDVTGPEIVNLAHEAGCKVMLTITSFGRDKNRRFLRDTFLQQRLIDDIVPRMVKMEADGIDLDFELVPENLEKQMSSFVMRLYERLAAGDKRYELSLVLPKVNGNLRGKKVYDITFLQQYVDFFTLTAYDFRTGANGPGPISPLYSSDRKRRAFSSIEDVVYNYLEDGLDRKKLLLGLPNYGGLWSRHQRENGKDSLTFRQVTYSSIRKTHRRSGPPLYDRDAWAAKYERTTSSQLPGFDERHDVTWFDDSLTLSHKYDWVLEQQLGGVGIWALGYSLPQLELWKLVDEKFAPVDDTYVRYTPAPSAWGVPHFLLRYNDLIGVSGLFIFAFLAVGFVVALFDWRVREVFFQQKTLRFLYIVAAFALVTATLAVVLFLRQDLLAKVGGGWASLVILVMGMVLGVVLVRAIGRWFAGRRAGVP